MRATPQNSRRSVTYWSPHIITCFSSETLNDPNSGGLATECGSTHEILCFVLVVKMCDDYVEKMD